MVWRSPYRLIIGAPTSMADERADRSQLALAGSTLPRRATLQRRSHSILARAGAPPGGGSRLARPRGRCWRTPDLSCRSSCRTSSGVGVGNAAGDDRWRPGSRTLNEPSMTNRRSWCTDRRRHHHRRVSGSRQLANPVALTDGLLRHPPRPAGRAVGAAITLLTPQAGRLVAGS